MTAAIDRTEFDFERTFRRATGALQRHYPVLLTVTLLFFGLPNLGETLLHGGASKLPFVGGALWFTGSIYSLIALFGYFAIQPMIIYVLVKDNDGEDASFRDCLRIAMRTFIPALAVLLLFIMAVALGSILLIVPGLIIATVWLVSTAAVVTERVGVFEAFERSRSLTRGYRWQVFAFVGIMIVLNIITGGFDNDMEWDHGPFHIFGNAFATAGNLIQDLLRTAVVLACALLAAAVYCELRFIKEGATSAELAAEID